MSRSALLGVRAVCVALPLVLIAQFIQPYAAGAQGTSLFKAVCNLSVSASCPAGTSTTSVAAAPGNSIQYNITYSNPGTTAAVIISDTLQGGQTYVSCTAPFGGTCSYNAGTGTVTMSVTGTAGTGAINVVLASTAAGTISNQATATANGVPTTPSNVTSVFVSGTTPPSSSALTLSKQVRDVTSGGAYGTNITAASGDQLEYSITITNNSSTASGVTVSDTLQAGQSLVYNSCSVSCSFNGSTVTFYFASLAPGPYTMTFNVYLTSARFTSCCQIANTATATMSSATVATSNTTTVTVSGYPYPYPYPSPTPIVTPPFVTSPFVGTATVCGTLISYTPATTGYGYWNMNGMNYTLMPGLIPGGVPFTTGNNVCVTFTVNQYGQVTSLVVAPNLPAVNYTCGVVSQYTVGYSPYPGFNPYPGYNPYYPWGSYGPYPYNGTQSGVGTQTNNYYGWGGPILVGGYPYQVAPGTVFPYSPVYGNSYCFLTNPQGAVTGSLSTIPTAAFPVEEPSAHAVVGHKLIG